MKTEPQQFQ